MARKGRQQSETGIYHILLRGVNLLFAENADYDEFTNILARYAQAGDIKIFAYSLLKNRIHLVIDAGEDVGKALKPICTSYARYFNRTHSGSGKLFYDRFKSEPVDSDEDLKGVVAFVNAVAQKCGASYPYSSLSSSGEAICTKEKLTAKERKSTEITAIYMEDFDCLSQKEISQYIYDLCKIMPKDFKHLPKAQLDAAIEKLTQKRWIARTKLYDILGIKKAAEQKPQEKKSEKPKAEKKTEPQPKAEPKPEPAIEQQQDNEPAQKRKNELSFWLL